MKQIKTLLIPLLLVLLLVLSACQAFPVQRKEQVRIPEVKTGTEGIVIQVLPNAPPTVVFEDSLFNIAVDLKNKGASDVSNGLYVLGIEEEYFSMTRDQPAGRFAIRGKSIFNPEGEQDRLDFAVQATRLLKKQQSYQAQFIFSTCYQYVTDAVLQMCVDTDLLDKQPQKACKPEKASFTGGQGAPVAITKVEPRMLPHQSEGRVRPDFVITIKNLGKGQLVSQDRIADACSGRPLGDDGWGIINIQAFLSDTSLVCSKERFQLRPPGTAIVCSLPEGIPVSMGTYTAPLTVKLSYGYVNSIVMPIKITKPMR